MFIPPFFLLSSSFLPSKDLDALRARHGAEVAVLQGREAELADANGRLQADLVSSKSEIEQLQVCTC